MSERDSASSANDSDATLGDLFENLPEPTTQIPTVDNTPPAPGSRRAAREAASGTGVPPTAAAPASGPAEPVPAKTTSTEPIPVAAARVDADVAAAVAPVPTSHAAEGPVAGGGLEDLFHHDHDDHDGPRRPKKKRRTGCLVALIIVLVILGGAAAGGIWVWNTYGDRITAVMGWGEPTDYADGQAGAEVFVTIVEGDDGQSISETLHAAGVTKTKEAFYEYLIAENANPTFYPGVFRLQEKMSSSAALAGITNEDNRVENSITIPEGYTAAQAITAIAAATGIPEAEFLAEAANYTQFGIPAEAPSIEGYLFPATYVFDPNSSGKDILQRLVDETFTRLDALGVAEADRFRILTLAALVQKESGPSQEDMRKIARVFLNRIDDGMLLQSDATVAYGAGITGTVWTTPEQRADTANLYNTYAHPGLPVGPISLPGEQALEAAIGPADGTWMYFVAVDLRTGETLFSDTYEQHLVAVDQLDDWCRVEENKPYCA